MSLYVEEMTLEEKIGKLEEEALKRKERLKALKDRQNTTDNKDPKNKDAPAIPKYVLFVLLTAVNILI